MKPQQHLKLIAAEAKELSKGPSIKTEEGRKLLLLITRLAETLAYGEPSTAGDKPHHS